jgi:signal transduction histidine kinase/CheY-like chemotaxis protein
MRAGAADYLTKGPLTADLLERSIRYSIQQRRSEEQRIRLLREQAARVEAEAASQAKDRFLSVLSHELRTPLTPVLMAVGVLESDPDFPEHLREYLEIIRQSVDLEARLIDDLLDLTRIHRGTLKLHFEVVDLHAAIDTAVRASRGEAETAGLELTFSPGARDRRIWADPGRIQQVLLNLLRNAVKFTPSGGAVRVTSANERSGRVAFRVSDTGVGIEPHVLPRIFDAFQQGESEPSRRQSGLGLGLSVARLLVERHGGTISAASEGRGRGAIFTVEFDTVAASERGEQSEPGAHAISLLLVEDHPETLRLLARLLRGFRYHVQTASNVEEALHLADRYRFDVVVSDIGLPDGSGLDLMRRLRDHHGMRGIAVSGFGMEEDRTRSLAAGFSEHLIKPVDFRSLRAAIERLAAV